MKPTMNGKHKKRKKNDIKIRHTKRKNIQNKRQTLSHTVSIYTHTTKQRVVETDWKRGGMEGQE